MTLPPPPIEVGQVVRFRGRECLVVARWWAQTRRPEWRVILEVWGDGGMEYVPVKAKGLEVVEA